MTFKVILPITLPGDGIIHRFGDVVEIDNPEVAREYRHAIVPVAPTVQPAAATQPVPPATHPPAGIVEGERKP